MKYTCEKHTYVYGEDSSCPYCDINDATTSGGVTAVNLEYKALEQRKRDRFELAKAAMQGLMANPNADCWEMTLDDVADLAVEQADATLIKLEQTT